MGRDRSYWALSVPGGSEKKAKLRSELEDVGYKPTASLTRNGLVALLQHHEAGHLCYDKCTDGELRTFAIDRGLLAKKGKPTRARLISLLFKADSDPGVFHFSNLPPELRSHVYDFYLADLTTRPLSNPADPPLTRASRLLRSESLAAFYNTCTFCVAIEGDWGHTIDVTGSTKRFLQELSYLKLQSMRNLVVTIATTNHLWDFLTEKTLMRTSIKFSPSMDTYSIECVLKGDQVLDRKHGAVAIRRNLKRIFDHIVGRQGPRKLKASDLINLSDRDLNLRRGSW